MDIAAEKKEILAKDHVKKDYVIALLNKADAHIKNELGKTGNVVNVGKLYKPIEIKKFDIVTAMVYNCPHPCLVYKVVGDKVYAFGMTTKVNESGVFTFQQSRFFENNTLTNTLVTLTKEEAIKNFAGVFDNRRAANQGFKTIEDFYKQLLK